MNPDNRYEGTDYPLSALTSRIIACAVEVHKTLGPGFEEVFYQRALHRELSTTAPEEGSKGPHPPGRPRTPPFSTPPPGTGHSHPAGSAFLVDTSCQAL